MSVLTVRARIKPEAVEELENAVAEMFAAIEREAPDNIRYASCRLAGEATYLILLQVEDGTENPLPGLPEFQRFQASLRDWTDGPPEAGPAQVIGSYRMF